MMKSAEDDDLATPLVAKVPVEVHPRTEAESRPVRVPVLPPESVHRVGVLVPVTSHWQMSSLGYKVRTHDRHFSLPVVENDMQVK